MLEGTIMLLGVLLFLTIIYLVKTFKPTQKYWKIKKGADFTIEYLELDDNREWQTILFECEKYAKNVPRHALYIKKDWSDYPVWAQLNKEEIVERMKSELKEPEYTVVER